MPIVKFATTSQIANLFDIWCECCVNVSVCVFVCLCVCVFIRLELDVTKFNVFLCSSTFFCASLCGGATINWQV